MQSAPLGCILPIVRPLASYRISRHFASKRDKIRNPRNCWQWASTSSSRVNSCATPAYRLLRTTFICCELVARQLESTDSQRGVPEPPFAQVRYQPEAALIWSMAALQRLLPLSAAGRTTTYLVIALIQSAKAVTSPMTVLRSAAAPRQQAVTDDGSSLSRLANRCCRSVGFTANSSQCNMLD